MCNSGLIPEVEMRMSGSGYEKSCFSFRVPHDLVIYHLRRKLALFVEDILYQMVIYGVFNC